MKCFVFNPYYWLLSAVGAAALLALLSIPMQDGEVLWFWFILSKIFGLVLIYADVRLFVWLAKHRKIDDIIQLAK